MTRPRTVAALMAAAVLTLQVAWILGLPPYRGIDEFDHAYRAAGVAHGQVLPSERQVTEGRGQYVEAPRTVVEAAGPVCEFYPYTGPHNCGPARDVGGGWVDVASGAGLYHPAFYWVVGTLAAPFQDSGTAYVYALRAAASLLCAALVGAATLLLARTCSARVVVPALAVAMTPMFVFSITLGAPNGVEMASGLLLWAALIALRRDGEVPTERLAIAMAGLAAAVLVTTRLLGPLWLGMVLLAGGVLLLRGRLRPLWERHRTLLLGTGATVGLTGLASLAWVWLSASNLEPEEADAAASGADPLLENLADVPLWVLQSIGAFPTRTEPAPALVYVLELVAFGALLGWAGRRHRRVAVAALLLVGAWLGVQLAVTVATYSTFGDVWQGRYALPYAVGIPVVLAVLAADRGRRPPPWLVVGLLGLVTLAHTLSVLGVRLDEGRDGPLADSALWPAPAPLLVALLPVLAGGLVLAAWRAAGPARPPSTVEAATDQRERLLA